MTPTENGGGRIVERGRLRWRSSSSPLRSPISLASSPLRPPFSLLPRHSFLSSTMSVVITPSNTLGFNSQYQLICPRGLRLQIDVVFSLSKDPLLSSLNAHLPFQTTMPPPSLSRSKLQPQRYSTRLSIPHSRAHISHYTLPPVVLCSSEFG